MIFLLDTNAVSALAADAVAFLERRVGFAPSDFGISSIVAYEYQFGILKGGRPVLNQRNFDRLQLAIVFFDAEDARAAAAVRHSLFQRGLPIGPYDILIAGQALARGLTLITRNIREFARVDGLQVESWE